MALSLSGATIIVASRNREALETVAAGERSPGRVLYVEEIDIAGESSLRPLCVLAS